MKLLPSDHEPIKIYATLFQIISIRINPLESITAHHWEVSDRLNKLDCRLSALVPILTRNHNPSGIPHDAVSEDRFRRAKAYLDQGIPVVPTWWDPIYRREHIIWLRSQGFTKYKAV